MIQKTPFALILALTLAGSAASAVGAEETLLLIARHAEKQSDSGNPNLTDRGLERAEALADIATEWQTRAVYSTDFCRTTQTAQPTAARLGVPIAIHATGSSAAGIDACTPPITSLAFFLDASINSTADFLSWVLDQHAGQTVLIVGHSNTVPRMLARLGAGSFDEIQIADDEYDRLFMVTYDSERGARFVERSYGEEFDAPEPETEPTSDDEAAANADAIVQRAIEVHGGEVFDNSRTRLTITSLSGAFDLDVRRHAGAYDLAVTDTRDGATRMTRITNDNAERSIDGRPQSLDEQGARRARSFVDARVYFPFLPYGLDGSSVQRTYQGLEAWNGVEWHRIKVTFESGSSAGASDEYVFWFDPESGRLEQLGYSFGANAENGGLRLRRLHNFRQVGGMLFADTINLGVDGPSGFDIDSLDPGFAAEQMREVSRIDLTEIVVDPLL